MKIGPNVNFSERKIAAIWFEFKNLGSFNSLPECHSNCNKNGFVKKQTLEARRYCDKAHKISQVTWFNEIEYAVKAQPFFPTTPPTNFNPYIIYVLLSPFPILMKFKLNACASDLRKYNPYHNHTVYILILNVRHFHANCQVQFKWNAKRCSWMFRVTKYCTPDLSSVCFFAHAGAPFKLTASPRTQFVNGWMAKKKIHSKRRSWWCMMSLGQIHFNIQLSHVNHLLQWLLLVFNYILIVHTHRAQHRSLINSHGWIEFNEFSQPNGQLIRLLSRISQFYLGRATVCQSTIFQIFTAFLVESMQCCDFMGMLSHATKLSLSFSRRQLREPNNRQKRRKKKRKKEICTTG